MTAKKTAPAFEYSAGGLVRRNRGQDEPEVLMVKVKNLLGRIVWTLPKGHIEKEETAQETAVREVREETGWECRVVKELPKAKYWFRRGDGLVRKTVRWFEMEPVRIAGRPDAQEILSVAWLPLSEARRRAVYRSDRKLLAALR